MQRGTLVRWNAGRGFGFIKPNSPEAKDVFIHISTLKHMSRPPEQGDTIIFQTELAADGKPRASIASIEGVAPKARPSKKTSSSGSGMSLGKLLKGLVLLGLIAFAVPKVAPMVQSLLAPTPGYTLPERSLEPFTSSAELPNQVFQCEGKTHCSQMQSCEEATFYLNNCPNTEMDGDGDGIPCERQWCNRY